SSRTGGNEGGTGGFHEFLLGIAGNTDHLKLVNLTNLGSHQPDPATGAEHHHALTWFQLHLVGDIIGRRPGNRNDGGLYKIDLFGFRHRLGGDQHGVLGQPAISGCHNSEHFITYGKVLHSIANLGDHTGRFLTHGSRQVAVTTQLACPDLPIHRVYSGSSNLNGDFAVTGCANGLLNEALVLSAAKLGEDIYLGHESLLLEKW